MFTFPVSTYRSWSTFCFIHSAAPHINAVSICCAVSSSEELASLGQTRLDLHSALRGPPEALGLDVLLVDPHLEAQDPGVVANEALLGVEERPAGHDLGEPAASLVIRVGKPQSRRGP